MNAVEIKKGIYWVAGIDWKLRDFHGYLTQRGSTYNAYLIVDKKITLIDTVKHYLYDEMLSRITSVIDPSKIDYIVSNHVEMDHSGSLPKILQMCPGAVVVTSPNGEKGLKMHYRKDWNFKVVKTGDSINIGERNIQFVLMPMVSAQAVQLVQRIPEFVKIAQTEVMGLPELYPQFISKENIQGIMVSIQEELLTYGQEIISISKQGE